MSFPFYNRRFKFKQPDGTTIDVKGWGDQHHAVFETLDGYTVVKDPHSGFYCYAELSADGEEYRSTGTPAAPQIPGTLSLRGGVRIPPAAAKRHALAAGPLLPGKRRWEVRREEARQVLRRAISGAGPLRAPPQRETRGDFVGLCLLIDFPNVAGTISKAEVENFCNQEGYQGYGNNGSVYDYFLHNSNGQFRYTNIVTEYYTASEPVEYYADPAIPQPHRTWELIRESLLYLKAQGFDFTGLSADDQGYVYALNVFYAGYCPNNWAEGIWPHSYFLGNPVELAPGRTAHDYQITDMGGVLTLDTFCHENGHMVCDYPDLYDYGYESKGVGDYCLMCSGGSDPKNPTEICAYLKHAAGWASSATPLASGMTASAPATGNVFFRHSKSLTEYFIIENRLADGRDAGLPSSGLAIWHVDELGSNNDEHMTAGRHYECSLEQADGEFDLENGVNHGDATDLFSAATEEHFGDATQPSSKWWDGTPSGLEITGIGAPGDVITFRVGPGNGRKFQGESSPDIAIPDMNNAGVTDTIGISGAGAATVNDVTVSVDITHTYRGDLLVTLTAPSGAEVVLHDRGGGRNDDLRLTYDETTTPALAGLVGEPVEGPWTLNVRDLATWDEGSLNHWAIEITSRDGADSEAVVTLEESPGKAVPDNDPTGIERTLTCSAAGRVKDLTIDVDITHTYIRDLVVTLESPQGNGVDLHHRTGGSADNIIRTFDLDTTPGLKALIGESITGDWKLKVSDREGADRGKLNHWRLTIIREP